MLEAENSAAAGGDGQVPGGFGEEEREGGGEGHWNFGGNRWPREETLALLKIRSDMDVAFRDSALKAPLWDEVSRKLAELGYYRNAKKCKEKFENIYKYHKRTKECRPNTKNYRFFEQLELLDNLSSLPLPSQNKIQSSNLTKTTMANMMIKPLNVTQDVTIPFPVPNSSAEFLMSTSASTTSSSGKESEGSGKRTRKLGDYFEKLMREVLEKQENLQKKFIEALEKCEKDQLDREEAWKVQELARIKREKEMLAQERAISMAKDAAVIAFLQKISEQANPSSIPENPISIPIPIPIPPEKQENGIAENSNSSQVSSSRWPKAEVEALISVRANLDLQYQDNGSPKGPLWEEISSSMKKLGYDRSAKRCKEKWENINKYFRRVKESNKKRPEDSKTCPYFQMLESLYQSKAKKVENSDSAKPEDILMQMMGQPQQQQQQQQQRPEPVTEDGESENVGQNEEDYGEDDDDDDENGDNYQIVANNPCSLANME
ncbi:trihelix transcription factor DF1-like [Actinidia eriantha]|uniref:trihelix transcription factor DF1-like n=1 Tax=Actinidia eriantha TaxID=165200 RepID=UPI00258B3340|nr:trihelix transcription factor DF1-like [Actinidia eriantha]